LFMTMSPRIGHATTIGAKRHMMYNRAEDRVITVMSGSSRMSERRRRPPTEPTVAESLVRVKPPDQCKYYLSMGSTLLDLAVSDRRPGGVGSGRTTQIIGDNSTAKSAILKEILGAAQRLGGYAVEEDAEYTPDFARAALFGLDVGIWADEVVIAVNVDRPVVEAVKADPHYCYRNPTSVEGVWDEEIGPLALLVGGLKVVKDKKGKDKRVKAEFKLTGPLAVGVDTFTALPSLAEQDESLDKGSYRMERAKRMSAGFRKWLRTVAENDVTGGAVDHIRDAVGVVFGPQWTTSGGKAMQQYASTRIFLATSGSIKNARETEIGVWIRAKVVKNKIAPPHREVRFAVLFDYGIDDVRSNLEWLKENAGADGKLGQAGAWFSWGEAKLGQGLEGAISGVEDGGLEAEVEAEVERVWRVVHTPPDRKARRR